jgi:hypothetical protein
VLEVLERVARLADEQAVADDVVEVDEHLVAQQLISPMGRREVRAIIGSALVVWTP